MKCIFFVMLLMLSLPGFSQQKTDYASRQLLLRDEGLSQVSYVDLKNPAANWMLTVPKGRDLQLIGNNLFLMGTENGFEEREIKTGKQVFELTSYPGTIAARRLRNGNTLLTGLDWKEKKGIVLLEIDKKGNVLQLINYPKYNYVRLARETMSNTYVITSDTLVFEGDKAGMVKWEAKIKSEKRPHSWQPLRLSNGNTVVSTGYGGNIQIFSADGSLIKSITGPDDVKPSFYAGLQILKNGNFLVTNWQGHGPGHGDSGTQLLEYNPEGKLVWSWKQDASKYSSLQGVIALDGLNLKFLHVEGADGNLVPVKTK
jgi:hypothetical protein